MRITRRISITQELIDGYGRANGDSERLHYDGEYARQHGFRGPIAHGTLVAATVFDLALEKFGPEFLRRGCVSLAWKSAVCAGDTQRATLEEDGRIEVINETAPGQAVSLRGHCSLEGSE